MKKAVVIASTGGSVLSKVIHLDFIKDSIVCVVSDRECGAIEVAKRNDIESIVLPSKSGEEFSDNLLRYFGSIEVDLFISFYTRIFKGGFLGYAKDRLVNFHPSLLPACPGRDGFGDMVKSGCRFIGSTVHYVDEGVDTGKPLIQAIIPYDPNQSLSLNRHKVFIQQCKMFIQIISWLNEDRINGTYIKKTNFNLSEFSPNLDSSAALSFWIDL